jgi:beta-lactamase regulating signal transducer with metallopeptidase domain
MKMSLIVFGALAVLFFLRRRSAALRHWVLATGVACAALVPFLTAVVPRWPLPFATPTAFSRYEDPFQDSASPATQPSRAAATPRAPAALESRATLTRRLNSWDYVRATWLAGAAVGLSILLIGLLRLAWLAVHARRITHGRWHDLGQEISRSYGLQRPVTLLESPHSSLLVTWGFARPKVILPAAAAAWTDERVRVVLTHELAHIRRGDWIVQLSAELLRAIYWFNPLLWLACRRLRLESEHACDDEVMSRGVEGADYATHLIELARALNQRRHMWFPAPAMARSSSLERRVRAMLNVHHDRGSISRGTRSAIFLLLICATTIVAAAQSGFVSLTGRVADEQGKGVPAVTVVLLNEARQAKYEVKTNAGGQFEFVGLPAGDYGLEATGMGFQGLKDVVTVSGQNLQRNYTLKLGTLQETIIVTDDGREHRAPAIKERTTPPRGECAASGAGGQIKPPRKIRDLAPIYPANLRGTGTSGAVQLKGRIALDGYLTDISVEGEAQPDMASAAVAAVREWQFTETLLNCQPVDVVMNISVTFKGSPALQTPR